MNCYFYCYSIRLKDFLKLCGLHYVRRQQHRNGRYYWIFLNDSSLDECLKKWARYKEIFKQEK